MTTFQKKLDELCIFSKFSKWKMHYWKLGARWPERWLNPRRSQRLKTWVVLADAHVEFVNIMWIFFSGFRWRLSVHGPAPGEFSADPRENLAIVPHLLKNSAIRGYSWEERACQTGSGFEGLRIYYNGSGENSDPREFRPGFTPSINP